MRRDKAGYVYIFEDISEGTDHEGFIKIGFTTKSFIDRQDSIKRCGRRLELRYHFSTLLPRRVEKLVLEELKYFCRPFSCPGRCRKPVSGGPTTHGEWFDAPLEVARECVERWIRFINLHPYSSGSSRKLKACWTQRLQSQAWPSMSEMNSDHRIRNERWDQFVQPMRGSDPISALGTASVRQLGRSGSGNRIVLYPESAEIRHRGDAAHIREDANQGDMNRYAGVTSCSPGISSLDSIVLNYLTQFVKNYQDLEYWRIWIGCLVCISILLYHVSEILNDWQRNVGFSIQVGLALPYFLVRRVAVRARA